jgi:hypothetical protein
MPKSVDPHHLHKVIGGRLGENGARCDSCVGEENIQSAVRGECVLASLLDCRFVRGVETTYVDVYFGIKGVEFSLVCLEVIVIVVADVDCLCAVLGKLVC